MNIFVINSGSSSIKYQLFHSESAEPVCSGLVERIGLADSLIKHTVFINGEEKVTKLELGIPNHEAGMFEVEKLLLQPGIAVVHNPDDIHVVGHRIVHGGETLTETTIITDEVKDKLKQLYPLAPLHNPGHIKGIEVAQSIFNKATQVAVFDTAFHQTMPEKAYRYAIPENFYKDYGIRVYGFHGISHKYVSGMAIEYLQKPAAKIITIHLGNGCSMAAVNSGKCIDTSMGLTPLDGLIMGTRSGNIDASVLLYLIEQQGYDAGELTALLNKKSGMYGLTGYSDMRDITKMINEGNAVAALAYEMYAYRIRKFIGSYSAAMNGLDAIVFTAGVGENDALVREMACRDMDFFGIELNVEANARREPGLREVNTSASRVKVLVIPTNEELEIAQQCKVLLS